MGLEVEVFERVSRLFEEVGQYLKGQKALAKYLCHAWR